LSQELSGNLLHNLVLFGRLLRTLGLEVNPGRMMDLAQALEFVEIGRKSDFYYTARSLLVHRREDLPLFDQAFELFWRRPSEPSVMLDLFQNQAQTREEFPIIVPPMPEPGARQALSDEEDEEDIQKIIEITRSYNRKEVLRQKDFGELTAVELEQIKQFMTEIVWELGQRRTRRQKPGRGRRYDLRRSLRRNLRYGGEWLEWASRQPKYKPRPLILIADISGSMEQYTRLLLQFLYSLAAGLTHQVETFVFSTRLTRISRQLRYKDVERALEEVATAVPDWAGGTRIGDALKNFNFYWGRRVLGRGAVVLIISDGWDRGDPDLLQQEIGRLHRSCHRLIWLNPLLGSEQYEPLTRGMQAALPFIDDFLPVHNLASLEDLAIHLQQLTSGKRPFSHYQSSLHKAAFVRQR
jgi:uncharacterized protein with von Willebrand factor type A (vWA) domain